MDRNNNFIKILGKEKYVSLLKKYNLCTKKWTYGRAKGFYKEIDKLVREYYERKEETRDSE